MPAQPFANSPFDLPPGLSPNGPPKGTPFPPPATPPGQSPVLSHDEFVFFENDNVSENLFHDNGSGVDLDPNGDELLLTELNGQSVAGPTTINLTTIGGREISLLAETNGAISFSLGAAFDSLAFGETDTISFTYLASDTNGFSAADNATVTIVINGENDAPTLQAGTLSAVEDGPAVSLDLSLLADDPDSDDDGTSLSYSVTGQPGEGSVSIGGTTLIFDPGSDFQYLNAGETSDVVVQVTATDAHGATAVSDITVSVEGLSNDVILLDGFERGLSNRWDVAGGISTIGGTLGTTQSEGNQALWLLKQWGGSASQEEIEEFIGYDLPEGWGRGDAISREFYFEAGDIISFDYRITSGGEYDSFYLDPNLGIVFIEETASNYYKTRSFEIPEDGYYDLTFGSESMLLDNITLL